MRVAQFLKLIRPSNLDMKIKVTANPPHPIVLNENQEGVVKRWAADDRLWTTQETVEYNLRLLARGILAEETGYLDIETIVFNAEGFLVILTKK